MTEKEFIQAWIAKIKGTLRSFPMDYIGNTECRNINFPSAQLVLGEELFGKIEITDLKGNSVLMLDDMATAKYYMYSTHNNITEIQIPVSLKDIESVVRNYEKDLDSIIKNMETDYYKNSAKAKNFLNVSNEIFNSLNLKRY